MQKPTSLTVFGILNLLFGVLGLCGNAAAFPAYMMGSTHDNPVLWMMKKSVVFSLWNYAAAGLGLLLALAMVISGIGLLMAKRWGRLVAMGTAGTTILLVVLNTIVISIFMLPAYIEMLDESGKDFMLGASGVGGLAGGCIGLVYPVLLIVFMMRKPVVEFFKA